MAEEKKANLKQLVRKLDTSVSQNHLEKLSFYEQYSDGKISREEYAAVRDRLAAEEERAKTEKKQAEEQLAALSNRQNGAMATLVDKAHEALDAPAFTNRMLLFFIERIDIHYSINKDMPDAYKKMLFGHSARFNGDAVYDHEMDGNLETAAKMNETAFMNLLEKV